MAVPAKPSVYAIGRRMFSVPACGKQPEPFLIVPNRKDYFPRIPCGACGGDHLAALLWLDPGVYKNWPGCSGDCPRIVKGTEEDLKGSSRTHAICERDPLGASRASSRTFFLDAIVHRQASVAFDPNWGPKPGTTWLMLYGTSTESDSYLSDVANQWVNPPARLEMREGESKGFEASENLYQLCPGLKGCAFRLGRRGQGARGSSGVQDPELGIPPGSSFPRW